MSGCIDAFKQHQSFPQDALQSSFPIATAGVSYSALALASAFSLYFYFTQITGSDFWHWQHVSFLIMLVNGLCGFSEFLEEDSFCPLRSLVDYCQVALVLPCYAAEMWVKTEMGPPEIATIHAGLGFIAALMYITIKRKRQDLTDLAVFGNGFSLLCVAALSANPFTLLATAILCAGYFVYKRMNLQCCLEPQDKFNFVMAAFALVSLASFDDTIVQGITDTVKNAIGGSS